MSVVGEKRNLWTVTPLQRSERGVVPPNQYLRGLSLGLSVYGLALRFAARCAYRFQPRLIASTGDTARGPKDLTRLVPRRGAPLGPTILKTQ